ncbi:MAG: hypothetical protein ACYTAF_01910 [Planctomycetota bacterium]|jgi:hypothetical protein
MSDEETTDTPETGEGQEPEKKLEPKVKIKPKKHIGTPLVKARSMKGDAAARAKLGKTEMPSSPAERMLATKKKPDSPRAKKIKAVVIIVIPILAITLFIGGFFLKRRGMNIWENLIHEIKVLFHLAPERVPKKKVVKDPEAIRIEAHWTGSGNRFGNACMFIATHVKDFEDRWQKGDMDDMEMYGEIEGNILPGLAQHLEQIDIAINVDMKEVLEHTSQDEYTADIDNLQADEFMKRELLPKRNEMRLLINKWANRLEELDRRMNPDKYKKPEPKPEPKKEPVPPAKDEEVLRVESLWADVQERCGSAARFLDADVAQLEKSYQEGGVDDSTLLVLIESALPAMEHHRDDLTAAIDEDMNEIVQFVASDDHEADVKRTEVQDFLDKQMKPRRDEFTALIEKWKGRFDQLDRKVHPEKYGLPAPEKTPAERVKMGDEEVKAAVPLFLEVTKACREGLPEEKEALEDLLAKVVESTGHLTKAQEHYLAVGDQAPDPRRLELNLKRIDAFLKKLEGYSQLINSKLE